MVSVSGFPSNGHDGARDGLPNSKSSKKARPPAGNSTERVGPFATGAVLERAAVRDLRPETIAAQAGGVVDAATGALVPPIHIATTFLRDADNQYRRGYCYGRSDNATVRQVEDVLTG